MKKTVARAMIGLFVSQLAWADHTARVNRSSEGLVVNERGLKHLLHNKFRLGRRSFLKR
jgi:hypothetical protein